MSLAPLLDTGAEISVFDGDAAEAAGWTMTEIVRTATDVQPISGIGRNSRPIDGYVHDVTAYIVAGTGLARLRFRAVITPPNTLAFPVLGRAGFFEQVDLAFSESEKMLFLRFRNPDVSRVFE